MKRKTQILLRKISQYCIYLILFLVPIFFLPFTSDFFEFNKGVIFIILTLVGTTTWAFSLSPKEEISVWKSNLDKPTIILITTTLISLIISKHFITSIFGFSGTLSNSVIFFFALLIFAFLVRNVLIGKKSIEKAILSIIGAGILVAILTILQYWGIFIFKNIEVLNFTTFRKFSTLGYEAVVPFYLITLLPFEIYVFNRFQSNIKLKLSTVFVIFLTLYSIVLSSGKIWIWPAFLTVPLTILIMVSTLKSLNIRVGIDRKILIPLFVAISALLIFHNIPLLENKIVTTQSYYSVQPRLDLNDSWNILANQYSDSIKEVLVGSGPDTYAYTFSKYKSASYSNSENAEIRFARSTIQIVEIASNLGILGVAAWGSLIYFVYITVNKIFKTNLKSEYRSILKTFSIELVLLLGLGFFTFFSSIFWILIWLCIGLISTLNILHFPRDAKRTVLSMSIAKESITIQKNNIVPILLKTSSVMTTFLLLIFLIKLYTGEVYYSLGKNIANSDAENDAEIVVNYMQSNNYFSDAIKFFKLRDDYYSDRSVVQVKLLQKSKNLSSDEDELTTFTSSEDQLRDLTLDSLKSTLNLNSVNIRNYKTAIYVYEILVGLTGGEYATELLGSINSGLLLDPNDPELHHKKGIILYLGGRTGDIEELEKAIELDPLYLQAYFDLASINHSKGNFGTAQELMETVVEILDEYKLQDLDIYNDLMDIIEDYESGNIPDQQELEIADTEIDEVVEEL